MKRYLIIKIGGSELMGTLISKALDKLVYFGEDDLQPKSKNLGTMLMFNFLSNSSIDDIMFAVKNEGIANFMVQEVTDDNFRANLAATVDKGVSLNTFKHTTDKRLSEMNAEELQAELDYAIGEQLYERCGEIKGLMNNLQKQ